MIGDDEGSRVLGVPLDLPRVRFAEDDVCFLVRFRTARVDDIEGLRSAGE